MRTTRRFGFLLSIPVLLLSLAATAPATGPTPAPQERAEQDRAQPSPQKAEDPPPVSADDSGSGAAAPAFHRHIEKQGIAVDLEIEPVESEQPRAPEGLMASAGTRAAFEPVFREGDAVRVRFTIRDISSSEPMPSLYPAAWMDRLPPMGVEEPLETCQDKVEAFVGGTLLAQPELDLNVYYVLALNDDASISVVDPLFGFGNSKLLAMAFLEKPGYDWALTRDQRRLFVSMPEAGKIAVVDTASWEVKTNIEIGSKPWRLALQPDEHYLWVAYRDPSASETSPGELSSGVAAVDTDTLEPVAHIPTGQGVHDLAFEGRDRYLFVSNRDDGTVSVIDIGRLEKVRDIPTAEEPYSLAHSEAGSAVYVSHRKAGVVTAIDVESLEVVARLEAEPGLEMIRFAPDGGRLGFVVNPKEDVLHIIDPATRRIVQTGDMEDSPDQVAFSDELVYVRHRGSGTILMIPRDEIGREGTPVPVVDFPGGHKPAGQMRLPTPADSIIQTPGATAVLVANPGDQAIYYYKEGMAAPMGHFKNYSRQPRAVRVVDRSLQEVEPGVYETAVQLRRPGRYDLAFFLDAPRMIHCFSVEVEASPELERERTAESRPYEIRYEDFRRRVAVGEEVALRFKIHDAVGGEEKSGLDDVQVLTFLAPGTWQKRHTARALGEDGYEVVFQPPRKGVYYVFVQAPSLGFGFQNSPYRTLIAGEASDPEPTGDASDEAGEEAEAGDLKGE